MATTIWVKVVGFSDVERHSLNTIFRLSAHDDTAYALWTPETASTPNVALVDVDSYGAGVDAALPSFNPHLKRICVGTKPQASAWLSLQRPVDWRALVRELDGLFASQAAVDINIDTDTAPQTLPPPGVKVALLVGMTRSERLYLRARLALAGMPDVDEVQNAAEASSQVSRRHYDLAIVGLDLSDADPWALVKTLQEMTTPIRSVIVATSSPSWQAMEQAERWACSGLLEIPFNPRQVMNLLKKA